MDYKIKSDTVKWHVMYSGLTGAELKVLAYLITSSEYKTGKVSASYSEMADVLGLSKGGVKKVIAELAQKKAINIEESAVGRIQSVYRVRSADELNAYYAKEINNPAADVHYDEETRLWGELIMRHGSIGEDCAECEELPGEGLCHRHAAMRKIMEDSQEWRDYKLWLADNPKPPQRIQQINGKPVANK